MNLNLNSNKYKNEREFHKYLFNYIKKQIPNAEYEKKIGRDIRHDIYFEFQEKKYIIECKFISKNFTHNDVASFLVQMLNYRDLLGEDYIYLCAICGEDDLIEKKFGTGYLYPTAQLFAAFGFYFLKWDKELPKHFNCEVNTILSYSNGSGMRHLNKKN